MITGLGHAAYAVKDIEASIEFYVEKLGMEEAFRMHGEDGSLWIVYLSAGNGSFVELFPEAELEVDPEQPASYKHLCLHVDDMAATLEHMAAKGLEPLNPPRKGQDGNTQAWVKDPDGNPIELMEIAPTSRQGRFLGQGTD